MDLNREQQQRKEFCDILYELAKSQEKLQDAYYRSNLYRRLEALYHSTSQEPPFRHFYSDIFVVLTQIQQTPELGNINFLGQNLDMIRTGYQAKNKDNEGELIDISDSINKLYDHVNLDIARISYSNAEDQKFSSEESIQSLKAQVNTISRDIEITSINIEHAEEKIANQQKEYIAILGIFAAVVLAFTGGIAFSTSVLNNISKASAYRTVLLSLIIGLILVNVLFGLFYYIHKIVSREEKILPLVISNAVILILILSIVLAWSLGWIESRNDRIHNTSKIHDAKSISAQSFYIANHVKKP